MNENKTIYKSEQSNPSQKSEVQTMIAKGYKNTEVGVIPNDWNIKSVKDFTDVTSGGTPSTVVNEFWGGNIRWMNSGELNLKKVFEVEERITETGLINSATKLIPEKCVLIGLAGQGKTRGTVAMNMVPLCTNQSIAAILPSEEVSPDYLYHNLDLRYKELRSISTGEGGRGGLNLTLIKKLPIPLPPTKAEQTAIATALNDADVLITQLEKLIAKKRMIKQGAMQKCLNPDFWDSLDDRDLKDKKKSGQSFNHVNLPVRQAGHSSDKWQVKKLGEIGKTYGGLSGKSKSDFSDGNCPYIPFMNIMSNPIIDNEYLDYVKISSNENQNKAMKGDLFFNGSSETPEEVGMCSVLLDNIPNLYLNSFCFGFKLNKELNNDALYLAYYFRSSYGRRIFYMLAQGATRHNLSKSNFLKIEFQIPKPQEQTRIAQILSDMDAEIETLEQKLEKYKMLKQGMMQNLLTGKIRLNH